MILSKLGKNTLKAEVSHISSYGVWLLVFNKEYFLPYSEFPWFKKAKTSKVRDVVMLNDRHLYWPQLDVDLELESLRNRKKYPLIYHSPSHRKF